MSAASMAKKGLSTMSFSKASQHAAVRCFTFCAKEEWDVNRNLCISLLHTPSMPLNTITGLWTKPLSNASHHTAIRCFTCCAKEEWDVNRNLCISLLHTPSMLLNTTTDYEQDPLPSCPTKRVIIIKASWIFVCHLEMLLTPYFLKSIHILEPDLWQPSSWNVAVMVISPYNTPFRGHQGQTIRLLYIKRYELKEFAWKSLEGILDRMSALKYSNLKYALLDFHNYFCNFHVFLYD